MTDNIELVTASVLLLVALIGVWRELRKVHHLVNSKMTQALDRIEQLKAALKRSDTEIPPEHYGVEDDWNKENE